MKAREILLALLIILGGAALTYHKSGRISWSWEGPDGLVFGPGRLFEFEARQEFPESLPGGLEIRNDRGAVEIESGAVDRTTVVLRKRIWRRNEAEARKTAEALRLTVERPGGRLVLSTNRASFRRRNFETDFLLVVPAGTTVRVFASQGPVKLRNTGPAEVRGDHVRVTASGIGGPLTVRTSHDDVQVDGVEGECRITCSQGDVIAQNLKSRLIMDCDNGTLRLERVGGDLTVRGSHADVSARDIAGTADIATSYEPIKIVGAAGARLRGHQSEIEAEAVSGPLEIVNAHGSVLASNIRGLFQVEGRNVSVRARGLDGGPIRVMTSYEDVALEDFTGPADIRINDARLSLAPRDLSGKITVQGVRSALDMLWPSGVRAPLQARTVAAEIIWRLAEKPASETTNGTSETKAFLDAAGLPGVVLSTTYADITIRERGSATAGN